MPNPGVAQGSAVWTELCTVFTIGTCLPSFHSLMQQMLSVGHLCTGILLEAGVKNKQSQVLIFVAFVFGFGKTFQFSKEFSVLT